MTDHHDARVRPPLWVRVGLLTINSRAAAVGYLWFTVALAVAFIAAGFFEPILSVGAIFFGATAWYHLSIKWADENKLWEVRSSSVTRPED